MPGQEHFGASDENFTSLLDPVFRDDQDGDTFDVNGPGVPGGLRDNTNYAANGDVVDFDPRIISNLLVDQTPNNPAAIVAALKAAGSEDIAGDSVLVQDAWQAIQAATTPEEKQRRGRRSTQSSRRWASRS